MVNSFYLKIAIVSYLIFLSFDSNAQFNKTYVPRRTYNKHAKELIDLVNYLLKSEYSTIVDKKNKDVIRDLYDDRANSLINRISRGLFIHDDSLENYVNKVMYNIVRENSLAGKRMILLARDPSVNADCYAQGIYIIMIGLLGRITTEDELAFTLSHEMAHDELGHVKSGIIQQVQIDLLGKTKKQVKKIVSGAIELEDIEEYRKLIYGVKRYSREKELQADSLAHVLLTNAGYDEQGSFAMLHILEESLNLKYDIGAELFLPFHYEEYPFQMEWLNDRLSVYSKSRSDDFMSAADSVKSHPDLAFRREVLNNYVTLGGWHEVDYQSERYVMEVTSLAEFETVESAFNSHRYDLCLFYALQLLYEYPHNSYIISRIGKVFLDLCDTRKEYYVSKYTAGYSEELRLVNSFLYNLTRDELGELGYHFLKDETHFNGEEKDHYYLLMRFCEVTSRNEDVVKLKRAFNRKFGESLTAFKYK